MPRPEPRNLRRRFRRARATPAASTAGAGRQQEHEVCILVDRVVYRCCRHATHRQPGRQRDDGRMRGEREGGRLTATAASGVFMLEELVRLARLQRERDIAQPPTDVLRIRYGDELRTGDKRQLAALEERADGVNRDGRGPRDLR